MMARLDTELARRKLDLYAPYAKQREFHKNGASYSERLFMAGNQLGKLQCVDSPVLTPTGWRRIGALQVGDSVIAGDGTITEVTGVFPQGVKDIYELEFDQGSKVLAGAEHLWQVTLPSHRYPTRHSHGALQDNPNFGKQSVITTQEMIDRWYGDQGLSPRPKQRVVMPHVGVVQFPARAVPVDPYALGAMLGDGCFRSGRIGFTSADDGIVWSLGNALLEHGVVVKQSPSCSMQYSLNGAQSSLRPAIISMGLDDKLSHEKFVPEDYLLNSPEVRLAVLQGLMDTDGSCDKNGTMEFSSASQQLSDDVAFLVRSFGGKARITPRSTSYTYKGEKLQGKTSYRVWIRLPQVVPFRLQRQINNMVRPVSTCDEHVLHSIRLVKSAEAVCIAVAHHSHLYVTNDFIVTHNTIAGGAEWAIHLTGRYPDWWEGATFNKAPLLWAGSVTGESTRDNPQRILMGPANLEEMWGTGFIPASCIKDRTRAMGVPNLLDSVVVRWGGGGDIQASESVVAFKAYEKGREKWQGPTVDGVWFDEEPPQDIYTEGLTRTNRGQRGQFAQTTFTPLLGMSEVVSKFLLPDEGDAGAKSRIVTTMTIEDVEHYTPEERAKIIASYPAHERKARASGIPILGSGRIFPLEDDAVSCKPFPIPDYWPRINGLDFGWDHPSAAVQLAWDRDSDCLYITHAHRLREALPVVHASTIKAWGAWVPTAWPHDGLQHDKGSGEQLAKLYKNAGLVMCRERATFEDGTNGVEAGLMDMLERMMTGRLKVFSHLEDWFSEFRLYHRKDGKVVKKVDDLMAATRYAVMMRRKAIVKINKDAAITPGFDPLDPEMGY